MALGCISSDIATVAFCSTVHNRAGLTPAKVRHKRFHYNFFICQMTSDIFYSTLLYIEIFSINSKASLSKPLHPEVPKFTGLE